MISYTCAPRLLESGRSPKTGLRDAITIGSLTYFCTQALDGCKGVCRIRETAPWVDEIRAWLGALPADIVYRGQRLPAMTQEVLLHLLKAQRRTPSQDERITLLALQQVFAMRGYIRWRLAVGPLRAFTSNGKGCLPTLPAYMRELPPRKDATGVETGPNA